MFYNIGEGCVYIPTVNQCLGIIMAVLCVAYGIARYYESGAARRYMSELHRVWRSMGVPGRVVACLLVVMCTLSGGSKGEPPIAQLFRMLFWHSEDIWPLYTANEALKDSSEASSNAVSNAISATNTMRETQSMVATQTIYTMEFDWPMENRTPPHDEQNVMADEMWRSNVWINSKMYHDHYIRFNSMVSTNPAIISIAYNGINQDTGEKIQILSDVTTNSYPQTFAITRPTGVYTCYMFRCAVPISLTNSVIGWDSEVVFGAPSGSGRGFNIAGLFVVGRDGSMWLGRTYTNVVYGVTNVFINGLNARLKE
jgi:hypothetical protein